MTVRIASPRCVQRVGKVEKVKEQQDALTRSWHVVPLLKVILAPCGSQQMAPL